jgi:hypothetical protein
MIRMIDSEEDEMSGTFMTSDGDGEMLKEILFKEP